MGEPKGKVRDIAVALKQVLDMPAIGGSESMSVVTPGGRIQVR
jgi:hypothetical protein